MISYHLTKGGDGSQYARGFKAADTNDIERLKRAITGFVWSPCIWRGGARKQENFERADWCVLDFDSGEMSLDEACNTFCDMFHIIGTTRSHQKEKGGVKCDRYRVALLFEKPIFSLRDYRYTMWKMTRRYPIDRSARDGARFFFPCTEIVQASSDGYVEECLKAPETFERYSPAKHDAMRKAKVLPPLARRALLSLVPVGERNTTWYWVAKELKKVGLEHEEIFRLVATSKTYNGQVCQDLAAELKSCICNGIKAAEREIADGRTEA